MVPSTSDKVKVRAGLSMPSSRTPSMDRLDVGTMYLTPTEVTEMSLTLLTPHPVAMRAASTQESESRMFLNPFMISQR